jgi:hypothetical protein
MPTPFLKRVYTLIICLAIDPILSHILQSHLLVPLAICSIFPRSLNCIYFTNKVLDSMANDKVFIEEILEVGC